MFTNAPIFVELVQTESIRTPDSVTPLVLVVPLYLEGLGVSFTLENFIQGDFTIHISGVDLFSLSDWLHKD